MLVLGNYSKAVVKKWGFNPNRIEMAKSFHWSKSYYYENLVWFYQNQGSYDIVVLQKLSLVFIVVLRIYNFLTRLLYYNTTKT